MALQYNLKQDNSALGNISPFYLISSAFVIGKKNPTHNWLFWSCLWKAHPVFYPLNSLAFTVNLTRAMGSASPGLPNIPFPLAQYSFPVWHPPSLEKTRSISLPLTFCYCMGLTKFSLLIPFLFHQRDRQRRSQGMGSDSLLLWRMSWKKRRPTSLKGEWFLISLNISHSRGATNWPFISGTCLSGEQDISG